MELLQNKRRIPLNGLQIFWLPSPLIARYSQWTLNDGLKWERHVIGGHWTELDWTGVNAIPPIYTYYRDLTAAPTALLSAGWTDDWIAGWALMTVKRPNNEEYSNASQRRSNEPQNFGSSTSERVLCIHSCCWGHPCRWSFWESQRTAEDACDKK